MQRTISIVFGGLLVLSLLGCEVSGQQAEELLWPQLSGPYVTAVRQWTRHDTLYDGINMSCSVFATLQSKTWRQTFVNKYAEIYSLSSQEREKMSADQCLAFQKGTDFVLSLEYPGYNSGRLSLQSQRWKIFLLAGGKKFYPLEIRKMRVKNWPEQKLRSFFPYFNRWQTYYTLHFPKAVGPLQLVVSGPSGRISMNWE